MSTQPLAVALVAVYLLPLATAQTPPCLGLNDQNTGVSGAITAFAFGGPTSLAWQFAPPQNLVVEAAQIFTQNTFFTQDMTLEIWSDNGNNLPGARLAGGAWRIWTTGPRAWQGANFDAAVALGQGLPYWIVWTEPGSSLVPTEPGGANQPSARLPSGGAWQTRTADAPKFRLFCNLLDAQNVTAFGAPCQGAAGRPTANTNHAPMVGNADFVIDGTGFQPTVPAVLVLGFQPGWTSIPLPGGPPGCFLHTDPFLLFPGITGSGNVRSASGSTGHVWFPLPIPNVRQMLGLYFAVQVGGLDSSFAVPLPFATTNALQMLIY